MRRVEYNPMNENLVEIVNEHMPALRDFVNDIRDAGVSPSFHMFGESSNSFTVIVDNVPLTFGRAECSESIKLRLAKLERLEEKLGRLLDEES